MSDNVTVKLHEIQAKGAVIWSHDHRTLVQPACLERRRQSKAAGLPTKIRSSAIEAVARDSLYDPRLAEL